ncbi:PaaI family thioesterase [Rhodococcus phenolicus]|uniref:PaaI family thioesterase n=1 Tax=Rhodococcus phenolicus TaxID=263849 RepID=UPI000829F113|nr:PaaI family thioesterase [Rhodococcus phenolicus]
MTDTDSTDTDSTEHARAQQLRNVVDGLRRLTDVLLRVDDDDPALDAAAAELDRIAALVEQSSPATGFGTAPDGNDPVFGHRNALAPPLTPAVTDSGTVSATGTLGLAYQGPRGLVHGGVSALLLDHVLHTAADRYGPAVLDELTVRYHRPVPLFEAVTVTCGHTDRGGADLRARGEITVDGNVSVSAQATYRAGPGNCDGPSRTVST